jgi:hypothetical protein
MMSMTPKLIIDFLDYPASIQDEGERQSFAEKIVSEGREQFADQALLLDCVSEQCRDVDFLRRVKCCRQALDEAISARANREAKSGTLLLALEANDRFVTEFDSMANKYSKLAPAGNYSVSRAALAEYIDLYKDAIENGFWLKLNNQIIFKSIFQSKNLVAGDVDYLFALAESNFESYESHASFSREQRYANKRTLLSDARSCNKASEDVQKYCFTRLLGDPMLIGRNELSSVLFRSQNITALQMLEILSVDYGTVADCTETSSVNSLKYEKRDLIERFFEARKDELFQLGKGNADILEKSFGWRKDCGSCRIGEALDRFKLLDVKSILIAGMLESKANKLTNASDEHVDAPTNTLMGRRKI